MITTETILKQILDENAIGAKDSIRSILLQKAKVYLEDKKRCLASLMYGPCFESKDNCDCTCDEEVIEDCGCKESV